MHDITFVGHLCYDEIVRYRGGRVVAPGSAVLCGALAAARVGKKVAVVTRLSERDSELLDPFHRAGITTYVIPAAETTFMKVTYPSENVDERILEQVKNAGFFSVSDIPDIETTHLHLAGITDREFSPDLPMALRERGYDVSCDLQSYVRQVQPSSGVIVLRRPTFILDILKAVNKAKLDVVEAEILTGLTDIEAAAKRLVDWGCPEVLITQSDKVLARLNQSMYIEPLRFRSAVGRTGRGDTTFAGYLAWRMEHDVPEALKFAAAIASLKMERPGPFAGSLEDVMARMRVG